MVYITDLLLQNQLHKVLSFCNDKKCIKKGKLKQLGCKIASTLANEHTHNYLSHQIIEQKKTMTYVDGNPGPGQGQAHTIWRG